MPLKRLSRRTSKSAFLAPLLAADHGRSNRIATGAAYATNSRTTVEDFLRGGAAFGMQQRQGALRGNPNPQKYWDDTAELMSSVWVSDNSVVCSSFKSLCHCKACP